MRCFVMFVTAVCILFLLKLKWPKNKSFYNYSMFRDVAECSMFLVLLTAMQVFQLFQISNCLQRFSFLKRNQFAETVTKLKSEFMLMLG